MRALRIEPGFAQERGTRGRQDTFHDGGRPWPLPVFLLALGLTGILALAALPGRVAAGPAADDSLEEPLPPALPQLSRGEVLFALDAAAFPSDSLLPEVEFYIRIPNDQLVFFRGSQNYADSVRLELRLLRPDGTLFRRWSRYSMVTAADSSAAADPEIRQILQWPLAVEPGRYVAELRVEDIHSVKKTLLGMMRKEHRSGQARGLLDVRPMPPDSLELSDLEFAERWSERDESVFRKRRLTVYPNPGHRYGREGDDLRVYFEGHLPRGLERADLRLTWEIQDRKGVRLRLLADTLPSGAQFDRAQVLRVKGLPASTYRLKLTAWLENGPSRVVEGRFEINIPAAAVLDRSVVALTDEAQLAFTDKELDEFEDLSPGDQEHYWSEYWSKPRADADGEDINALAEFERRIQVANNTYGGNEKGMLSDRGRTLIRYGEPDEVRQEVLPGNGTSLTDIGGDLPLEEHSNKGQILRQPGGRPVGDTRAYEIWDYDIKSRLVFGSKRRGARLGSRMRFVFVDDTGVGNYFLKYSSE